MTVIAKIFASIPLLEDENRPYCTALIVNDVVYVLNRNFYVSNQHLMFECVPNLFGLIIMKDEHLRVNSPGKFGLYYNSLLLRL